MSATTTFLDEARRTDAQVAWLVKVYLGEPTTRTLYLGMSSFDTPDGRTWEAAVTGIGDIVLPGGFLSTGVDDVGSASFKLASRASLCWQAQDKNVTNLFSDFRWIGAKVEIWMWPLRSTDIDDMYRRFIGQVQTYTVGPTECEVHLVQRDDWNRQLSPTIVSRDKFPRAPDRSVGLPLPIVYGKIGIQMRPPWPTDARVYEFEKFAGGQLGIPAICVDTGRGGSDRQKFVVAAHQIKSHSDTSLGASYYLAQDGRLVVFTPTALFNTPDGAGFELADDFANAFFPIRMTDVFAGAAGGGSNLPYSIDPNNELTFTRLDSDAVGSSPYVMAQWRGEAVSAPGAGVGSTFSLVFAYRANVATWAGGAVLSFFYNGNWTGSGLASGAVSTTPDFITTGGIVPSNWDYSSIVVDARWTANTGVPPAAQAPPSGVKIDVFAVGIWKLYKPDAKVYKATAAVKLKNVVADALRKHAHGPGGIPNPMQPKLVATPDTEVESPFYGTIEGAVDDSFGTYTGTSTALIERAPDITRHLLLHFGGQDAGSLEDGTGALGSFLDARTDDLTWRKTPMRHGLQVAERADLGSQIDIVAKSALAQCVIDEETDRFLWMPWREGEGVEYGRQVYLRDLRAFPEIEPIDSKRVPAGIAVKYGWDGFSSTLLHSTHCAQDGSTAGYFYRGIRDEHFLVQADINDRFVIQNASGGSLHGAGFGQVLPAGDYTDEEFLAVLHSFMFNYVDLYAGVAYGGLIIAGVNDNFQIKYGIGTFISCTIPAGRYTMEGQAAVLEAALEAADGGASWTVTYDRTTRKFSLTRAGGSFSIWMATVTDSAAAAYGFSPRDGAVSGSTITSEFALDEELIAFSFPAQFSFRFATNSFGSETAVPKTCADVIGFDPRFDREDAYFHVADSYKGHLELLLRKGAQSYGYTRDLVVEHRATYDTDTAREGRNRLVNWLREPRVRMSFTTWRMPDLKRGHVLRFDDLDNSGVAFPKRGSDGLWTGKTFRVLSVTQKAGNDIDQVVDVIENGAIGATEAPTPGLGSYGMIELPPGEAIIMDDFALPV